MESEPDEEDSGWLRSEAVQVYKQLRALALQLNTGHDDDSGMFYSILLRCDVANDVAVNTEAGIIRRQSKPLPALLIKYEITLTLFRGNE